MLKQQLEQDLKQALLAGNKEMVATLRSLKSVILYAEVAKGSRSEGLPDEEVLGLFTKEAKKRQESADLYRRGGDEARAEAELSEKSIIEAYLPDQLSDDELIAVIDDTIAELGEIGPQAMGQVIGHVKQKTASRAGGARIAQLVKRRLEK